MSLSMNFFLLVSLASTLPILIAHAIKVDCVAVVLPDEYEIYLNTTIRWMDALCDRKHIVMPTNSVSPIVADYRPSFAVWPSEGYDYNSHTWPLYRTALKGLSNVYKGDETARGDEIARREEGTEGANVINSEVINDDVIKTRAERIAFFASGKTLILPKKMKPYLDSLTELDQPIYGGRWVSSLQTGVEHMAIDSGFFLSPSAVRLISDSVEQAGNYDVFSDVGTGVGEFAKKNNVKFMDTRDSQKSYRFHPISVQTVFVETPQWIIDVDKWHCGEEEVNMVSPSSVAFFGASEADMIIWDYFNGAYPNLALKREQSDGQERAQSAERVKFSRAELKDRAELTEPLQPERAMEPLERGMEPLVADPNLGYEKSTHMNAKVHVPHAMWEL